MALTNNSLDNAFAVSYARESVPQFWAYAPMLADYTMKFDNDIQAGGTSVWTRYSTTNWTANRTDINGYVPTTASVNGVNVTLVQKDVTDEFSELEWATNIPEVVINTFAPSQGMALANTVVVDLLGSLSGSSANVVHNITGSNLNFNSASYYAQVLDQAFVPRTNRTLLLGPGAFNTLVNSLSPTYIYGNPSAVQEYEVIKVAGFKTYQYAGINIGPYNVASTATLNSLGTGQYWTNLQGIACHKAALCFASRPPLEVNNGLVTAVNNTDPNSGITLQSRITYIQQTGIRYLSNTLIYGCAAGNATGSVLIYGT